ncbi:Kinase, NEK [Ectocarpus siliculosus]|uniref:Kinase, NEK n=1 Tax=Ectocarpus siliculosus TaxID=2880 RepID=D7FN08_ECTSI|nr:Kinase, NEK [Ectocarpus siliculosus]|eukprot:CBJ30072.1 Kinase, NEK [Ectocarpus siliculosus]
MASMQGSPSAGSRTPSLATPSGTDCPYKKNPGGVPMGVMWWINQVPGLGIERRFSLKDAEESDNLLTCIEDGDIEDLHRLLSDLPGGETSVLTTPSLLAKHKMRTPLMAAAATGDLATCTATLQALNQQYSNKLARESEMRTQLTNRDREGMTALMLAARSSSVAVLGELLTEIYNTEALATLELHDHKHMTLLMHAASNGPAPIFQEAQQAMRKAFGGDEDLREMMVERDSDGLNLLMHAASCCAPASALVPAETPPVDPDSSHKKDGGPAESSRSKGTASKTALTGGGTSPADASSGAVAGDAAKDKKTAVEKTVEADTKEEKGVNKRDAVVVPVFKVAVRLVTRCLWTDEVLQQLKAVDLWGRSVLTHALLSGHEMMFEAAYGAVRDVLQDELVSEMMETNEGEREDTPMIDALARGNTDMRKLYALRAGQLKKDVDARSKLSTMDAKIEGFIPGKLVVMFQLLLPQIAEGRQLILLYIMCALAPLVKLATTGSVDDSDSKHTGVKARSNKLSVLLGAPAMFFWGVGTSTVGQTALGWSSSLSATSMAAATLAIPAVDSFFNSRKASAIGDKARLCSDET